MTRFRKKPVVIDAILFDDYSRSGVEQIKEWAGKGSRKIKIGGPGNNKLLIKTLEGEMIASPGDYIIRGVKGEMYPCKPDIFALTYERV